MDKIRRHYSFHGRVQGVGFRYTATHIARSYGLTGWVRNEYDGSVSMEVQGDRASINRMIQMFHNDRYIRVDWVDEREIPVVEDERKFGARY